MRLPVSLKPSPVGKVTQQGRMRGRFAKRSVYGQQRQSFPLISQRAGPLTVSPEGEAMLQKSAAPFPKSGTSLFKTVQYKNPKITRDAAPQTAIITTAARMGGSHCRARPG